MKSFFKFLIEYIDKLNVKQKNIIFKCVCFSVVSVGIYFITMGIQGYPVMNKKEANLDTGINNRITTPDGFVVEQRMAPGYNFSISNGDSGTVISKGVSLN